METAVALRQPNEITEIPPLTPAQIKGQVNLIQTVMRDVMRQDEHYGVIPGTGNKPTLLKPGAEKLIMTFRLVPDVEEQVVDLPGGHREYRIKVKLYAQNGNFLGAGVGSCSTMEGKYRFRTGPAENTGKPVPKDYWTDRNIELIGGKGYTTKKVDGAWMIFRQGEKVEHDNPADYYNTCLKMAKKRALVDACLTVTAASDIFTQDVEEMTEVIPGAAQAAQKTAVDKAEAEKEAVQDAAYHAYHAERGHAHPEREATPDDDLSVQQKLDKELAEYCAKWDADPDTVMSIISLYNGYSKKVTEIPGLSNGRAGAALNKLRMMDKDNAKSGAGAEAQEPMDEGDIPF